MRTALVAILLATSIAGVGKAHAEGGCGPGWHRAYNGGCYPNGGPAVVAPGPVVVERPVVVAPRCPYGFVWSYGRCRPI